VVFAAGRSTTDTELESMLESGNPAIFTQGVSCCPFSYAYSCLRKVAIIIVFIRHGSIYRKCHDISPISIILVSRCFGALDISNLKTIMSSIAVSPKWQLRNNIDIIDYFAGDNEICE